MDFDHEILIYSPIALYISECKLRIHHSNDPKFIDWNTFYVKLFICKSILCEYIVRTLTKHVIPIIFLALITLIYVSLNADSITDDLHEAIYATYDKTSTLLSDFPIFERIFTFFNSFFFEKINQIELLESKLIKSPVMVDVMQQPKTNVRHDCEMFQ